MNEKMQPNMAEQQENNALQAAQDRLQAANEKYTKILSNPEETDEYYRLKEAAGKEYDRAHIALEEIKSKLGKGSEEEMDAAK